jgi:hypothetical protein
VELFARLYDRLFPRYACFLVLGASAETPLWHWTTWREIVPKVSALAESFGTAPSVHSRQIIRGKSSAAPLGRLSWTEAGHQRWCHGSPLTEDRCRDWLFIDTEIFMPRRSQLIKARAYPVAYLEIRPVIAHESRRTKYDEELLLAVRLTDFDVHHEAVRRFISEVQPLARAVLTLSESRRVVSLNQFESILPEDFSYVGMLEDELPDLGRLRGSWKVEAVGANGLSGPGTRPSGAGSRVPRWSSRRGPRA